MSEQDTPDDRLRPPDELDPAIRFERYVVHLDPFAFASVDHLDAEQVSRIARSTGWVEMTRDELLREWRTRT